MLTPRCSNGIHFISIVDFNISQSTFELRWLCWTYTDRCLAFLLPCSWEGVVFGQRLAQVLSEVRALQQDTEPWRPRWGMTAWRVKHTFLNWALKKKFSKISLILRVWWSQPVVKMELERVHQKMRERILCVNLNSTETELSFHIVVENDDKVLLLFAAWREAFLSQALLCRPLRTKRCKLTSLC